MSQDFFRSPSSIFIYGLGLIFAGVIAFQLINGHDPSTIAVGFVTTVVGQAIMAKGTQHGVDVTNDTVSKVAVAQGPANAENARRSAAEAENAKKATAEAAAPTVALPESNSPIAP